MARHECKELKSVGGEGPSGRTAAKANEKSEGGNASGRTDSHRERESESDSEGEAATAKLNLKGNSKLKRVWEGRSSSSRC